MKNFTIAYIFLFILNLFLSPNISHAQCSGGQMLDTYCYDNGEIDNIAFEVCPSTGMAIESSIIQGSFFAPFNDNLTIYSGVSGSGTGSTIVFGPMTGNLAGSGPITSLGADQCLIFVTNSNTINVGISCADASELELQVCSQSVATSSINFTAPPDLCIDAGVQIGLMGGIPTGGVYSGTGVTDDGNGTSYSFDPGIAGAGTHTITYTNGSSASDDIEVFDIPTVSITAPADLCIDAGTLTGQGGATPSGGVYSGPGVTDDGNGSTYSFNPAAAGLGMHTITYTEPGVCMSIGTDDIEVLAACGCTAPETSHFHCGGGVENNLVVFEVCPSSGMAAQATINAGTYNTAGNTLTIYEGATGSGTTGTIVFGPSSGNLAGTVVSGQGADQCLIFVNNSPSGFGCQQDFETALEACGESIAPSLTFMALDDLCITEGIQTGLTGGFPVGGVYSGTGVTDGGDGMTYSFDPATAGAGIHTITYTNGTAANDDVEVFATGTAGCILFTAPDGFCVDAMTQTGLGGGTPIGGVYSGTGVTDDGNGMTYSFDPSMAGVGTHSITYTIAGIGDRSDDVEVFATPVVMFSAPVDVCSTDGIQSYSLLGSPVGGIYSGPGVTNIGDGISFTFDPAMANVGSNTITYSLTDENGCNGSASDDIEVFDATMAGFTAPDDLCIDAGAQTSLGGGTPVGGIYSGMGVTDDGNGTTYSFDPTVAGVGTHILTYTFGTGTQCSSSANDEIEVVQLPAVSMELDELFCVNDMSQVVSPLVSPIGGIFSGPGVTDNNNGIDFTFDPATAGVGMHDVTYTATEAGCSSSVNLGNGTSFSLASSNVVPRTGEIFTVDIIVNDFTDIIGFQYSINWDASLFSFQGISGFNLTGLGLGNFGTTQTNNGVLVVSWTDPLLTGQSAVSGSSIYTITFETLGTTGATADIMFSSNPVVLEVLQDQNGALVDITNNVNFNDVSIEIGGDCDMATCSNSVMGMIEVLALPVVSFTAPTDLCIDAGIQTGLGGGVSPEADGIYSGPGVMDDGNGMTYSFNPATAGVGVHTLTYTYTDENGCSNSADDMIEVFALPIVMFTAPTLDVCIEDPIVTGLGGGMPTGGVYNGTGVMDDANGMTFSFDPTASATMGGDITVTYTFTDANGCTASASDDIFVNPICCELIVSCPPASLGTITCNNAIPTAATDEASFEALGGDISDDPEHCGTLFISHVDTYNPPTDICNGRTLTRVYTIADDLTSENCTQTLMISAPAGPSIICPADMTVECLAGISVDPADAVVTTDCSQGFNTVITGPVQNGDADCPGTTYTYTYTTTDDCGRMASCEQVFTIENMGPTIICPADMTVECLADISLDPANATVTTSCTLGFNTMITGPVQNGDADCPGTTYTYTYTVTDDCGRMASCEQVFTIENMGPTITCPTDMTVECIADVSPDPADATVTTSCTLGFNTVITGPVQNGDADCPSTTYTYTYTLTDDCGRMASCEQVFTIENMGPTITCPADMTVECFSDIAPNPDDATVTTSCTLGFTTLVTGPVQVGPDDCPGTTYTYTYTTTDDCGRTASCEQIFTIDNQGPIIVCPADEVVTCFEDIDADPNNLTVTTSCGLGFFAYVKQPLITGGIPGCDGTVYTYIYVVVDDCGRKAECEQQFIIQNNAPTVTVPAGGTVTCFDEIEVSVSDVTVVADCDGPNVINVLPPVINGPGNCPGTTYTYTYRVKDFCNRIVEVDRVFTIGNNSGPIITSIPLNITSECEAGPSLQQFQAVSGCGDEVQTSVSDPVVIGTPGCNGTRIQYTYTATDACGRMATHVQTITLQNAAPTINCPETLNIINCEDGNNNDLINAWIASVSATASCGGALTVSNNYNGNAGMCINNGFTNVTFFATDQCGRTSTCVGTIIITDTEAPIIYQAPQEVLVPCNAVTQDIFNDWLATQGGAEAIDACWGDNISWSTNPANPQLNCAGGPQAIVVEFIARDGCGNTSSVTGIFNTKVQPTLVNISGQVNREDAEPVADVEMRISGGTSGIPDMDYTENGGAYGFPELEYEDNLVLNPEKNIDPLNGVSTYDLILMRKHILLTETLDSPYKRIAADVNRSGSISAFDMLLLRRLILYIDTEFTDNTSWRFVEADFVFPNANNPFETAFPENYNLSGLEEEYADFIGVKIGDLDLSAIANEFAGEIDDRSGLDDLTFEVEDQNLKSGEQYRIDFTAQNFEQINGFQFTLNFDQAAIEAISIEGADLSHFNENNYGMTKADNGAITVSWNHEDVQNLREDEVAFSLIVTANSDVQLSDVISITSEYTRAEAYQSNELMNVELAFNNNGTIVQTEAFRLFQNQPNPFKEATMIGFNLPEAGMVSLEIYDVSGRLIHVQESEYAKGYNQIDLDRADLPSGVLYYQINTATDSDSKRMILTE